MPADIEVQFRRWAAELGGIKDIPIPRYIFRNGTNRNVVLHGFCDASEKAYGAIVYISYEAADGGIETTFIMSKTRVAPLKTQTVARLELMGALVLAKLSDYVLSQFSSTVECEGALHVNEVHLWTDSEIALSWIRRPSATWKQFIRNRVQQIQELSDISMWRHCPGKENPADLVSRGVNLSDLKNNSFYWHGPSWLKSPPSEWPEEKTHDLSHEKTPEVAQEECKVLATCTRDIEAPPRVVLRSSKYMKTKRVLAWMLRFVDMLAGLYRMDELTAEEIQRAETRLIRDLQRRHFKDEIDALQREQRLPQKSVLTAMIPSWTMRPGYC